MTRRITLRSLRQCDFTLLVLLLMDIISIQYALLGWFNVTSYGSKVLTVW